MKYCIVGVTKCGTTSLEKYLKSKGHTVVSHETLATLKSGTGFFGAQYFEKGWKPVLIFRNEKDRLRSFLNYYSKNPELLKGQSKDYDIVNIKAQWKNFDAEFYHLEEMQQLSDFPHINQSIQLNVNN